MTNKFTAACSSWMHYWTLCCWMLVIMHGVHGAGPALCHSLAHLPSHHHSTHCHQSPKHDSIITPRDLHTIGIDIDGEE